MEITIGLALATYTGLIGILAIYAYMRARSLSFVVGVAILYYWSLYGAWAVLIDKAGGDSGKHYQYLESKLFAVDLDHNYFYTITLYAVFIIAAELTVLWRVQHGPKMYSVPWRFRHGRLLITAAVCAGMSAAIIFPSLASAQSLNTSTYYLTRFEANSFFTLHQIFLRSALGCAACGLAVLLSARAGRYFLDDRKLWHIVGYTILILALYSYALTLGDKNELLFALVLGVCVYTCNVLRQRKVLVTAVVLMSTLAIGLVDVTRGTSPGVLLRNIMALDFNETADALMVPIASNEAFGAHFSLYGVLSCEVELRPGYSLLSFMTAIVPRILWPSRPFDTIYSYYAASVGASGHQGYTIHHATGWYLNFGIPGVVAGGVLIGFIWAGLYNRFRRGTRPDQSGWTMLFTVLGPWIFLATMPSLVRTSIEGYKSVLMDLVFTVLPLIAVVARPILCEIRSGPQDEPPEAARFEPALAMR